MYEMTIETTRGGVADDPIVLQLDDEKDLNKVQRGLMRMMNTLLDIADDKAHGKKPRISADDPQTMTTAVNMTRDGKDFGGYAFRWPDLPAEARTYIDGLLAGVLGGTGHGRGKGKGK